MNANDLTMRQMREVQQVLGLPGDELQTDPFGLQAAIAWQVKKSSDPNFTFDQALDLSAVEIAELLGVDPKAE